MIHPHERFTNTVERYKKFRPDYPESLVAWVLDAIPLRCGEKLIDIGCGTGITTRLFATRGIRVMGVDPNRTMLEAARAEGAGGVGRCEGRCGDDLSAGAIEYVEGAAENLPFEEHSADGAICGQALHWVDLDRTVEELGRVLRPARSCVAFWNIRDDASTPFLQAYEQLLCAHSEDYPNASPAATIDRIRAHRNATRVKECQFENSQSFDRDRFFGRVWSSSYVVHGVRDSAAFNGALDALFARYQVGGEIEFRYNTCAIAFSPRSSCSK